MICRTPIFAGLDLSPRKPKQKLLRSFTSSPMGSSALDPQVQKTLNQLNIITHIDLDTYTSLLQACASSKALSHARHVHHHIMTHGHGAHFSLGFLILDTYGKCGAVEDATSWFVEMPCRTVCAWNYMMGLYSRHGQSLLARRLFDQMLQEGMNADKITYITMISVCTSLNSLEQGKKMNACIVGSGYEGQVVVVTALVNLYGKCGDPRHALRLFDAMPRRDTITWSALISGYKQNRQGKEVLQLFDQMLMEGVLPSRATFACTLSACTTQPMRQLGRCPGLI
eukprot:c10620_g1_i1 orf=878-1726(-)